MNIADIQFTCYWHKDHTCTDNLLCKGCKYQPADENKPNGKAAPLHIRWVNSYGGTEPECPACGEMPYSLDRCIFCGQRFLSDAMVEEWSKPPEKVRMDCLLCGGKDTVVGARAKINGHFHGQCTVCGARYCE